MISLTRTETKPYYMLVAMAEANLPEEIIVNIISKLPVKSLIRFSSVSKRWLSIILFDPDFAKSQFKSASAQKTLTRKLLVCSQQTRPRPRVGSRGIRIPPQLESLDLETPSSGDDSLFKKLNFPFQQRDGFVCLMGSCNGLVFVAHHNIFYVCNPLTGFLKELPDPGYSTNVNLRLEGYGVGYLSATDDYKVIANYFREEEEEGLQLYEMISLKDHKWRSIVGPTDSIVCREGTLINEALHWLESTDTDEIVAFDLAKEQFWKMRLPNFGQDGKRYSYLGVCFGGCLCVSRYPVGDCDSIDFWVMREYHLSESWTKLFKLRFSNPQHRWPMLPFLITESCTVAEIWTYNGSRRIRISYKEGGEEDDDDEEEKLRSDIFQANWSHVIEYEESLVWISGYNGVEKSSQGRTRLKSLCI